jgi:hypothetical protein
VIAKTLEEAPAGRGYALVNAVHGHDSRAKPQTAVPRIWRAFRLKPHPTETWKSSADPEFTEKGRDTVGLYLDPPQNALVLAMDEMS